MPRGGKRQGQPGKSYGNRSDMQQGPRQAPVMRVPGQPYGAQAQQVRDQQALPVAQASGPPPPAPGPQAAPTQIIPLDAPTTRPNEPLTAGVDVGAGPGAKPPPNPDAQVLAAWLPTLELIASQPGTSSALRNMVRRIRAQEPIA